MDLNLEKEHSARMLRVSALLVMAPSANEETDVIAPKTNGPVLGYVDGFDAHLEPNDERPHQYIDQDNQQPNTP